MHDDDDDDGDGVAQHGSHKMKTRLKFFARFLWLKAATGHVPQGV